MSYLLVITTTHIQTNKVEQLRSKRVGNNAHLIYEY